MLVMSGRISASSGRDLVSSGRDLVSSRPLFVWSGARACGTGAIAPQDPTRS